MNVIVYGRTYDTYGDTVYLKEELTKDVFDCYVCDSKNNIVRTIKEITYRPIELKETEHLYGKHLTPVSVCLIADKMYPLHLHMDIYDGSIEELKKLLASFYEDFKERVGNVL
jgi:hypothetical protein